MNYLRCIFARIFGLHQHSPNSDTAILGNAASRNSGSTLPRVIQTMVAGASKTTERLLAWHCSDIASCRVFDFSAALSVSQVLGRRAQARPRRLPPDTALVQSWPAQRCSQWAGGGGSGQRTEPQIPAARIPDRIQARVRRRSIPGKLCCCRACGSSAQHHPACTKVIFLPMTCLCQARRSGGAGI